MGAIQYTVKSANAITHKLSKPGKMPGSSYNTPAQECNVGTQLRDIIGSVCEGCYAFERGRYRFANVKDALQRRLASIQTPNWTGAMAFLINRYDSRGHFRWHDSGDLQSAEHLQKIADVCELTPTVQHWLPTREYKIVQDWQRNGGVIPENLVIRLSAHMVDGAPPTGYGLPTSTVVTDGTQTCPASKQNNQCGDCRACWTPTVQNVSYPKH